MHKQDEFIFLNSGDECMYSTNHFYPESYDTDSPLDSLQSSPEQGHK